METENKGKKLFISQNVAASEIIREIGKHFQTGFTTPVSLVNSYHAQIYLDRALETFELHLPK